MSHLNTYSHIEFYFGLSKLIWIKDKVSTYLHQTFCVMLLQLNNIPGASSAEIGILDCWLCK